MNAPLNVSSNSVDMNSLPGITSISVAGFKSIVDEQTLEVRPLTVLAGANSSGKSSMMQPLLLLKQTLEAQYDPGPLLLNGPNVKFTESRQFLSKIGDREIERFSVAFSTRNNADTTTKVGFIRDQAANELHLEYNELTSHEKTVRLSDGMDRDSLLEFLRGATYGSQSAIDVGPNEMKLVQSRCFFEMKLERLTTVRWTSGNFTPSNEFGKFLFGLIHVPGLRELERTLPMTVAVDYFFGRFDKYIAGLIYDWAKTSPDRVQELGRNLEHLGLTWKVEPKRLNESSLELYVGRLPRSDHSTDLVNLADVGFGVSQVLPVIVALRAAQPGQLVYIEQPEIHLHPKAQLALAELLANAAKRGVRVVVETHSSLLLLGIQTLVADGTLDPALVGLNWFARSQEGATSITLAEIDHAGRVGDWPEDFGDVSLDAQMRYIDKATDRIETETVGA